MSIPMPAVRRRFALLASALAMLTGLLPQAHAAEPPPPAPTPTPAPPAFLRYVDVAGQQRLETAITRYVGPQGTVDLVGAVHIGEVAYYRELQKRLDAYPKVLFELIKPEELDLARAGRADGGLSSAQRWLKDSLQLTFQLDEIHYGRKHFVHADIDPETLARSLRERMGSLFGGAILWTVRDAARLRHADGSLRLGGVELLLALGSTNRPLALKRVLARELSDMGGDLGSLGSADGLGEVLVQRRNEVAMGVLARTLPKAKKVAIFYGAAHLPDLEKRLLAQGFQRQGTEWLTAWDLRDPPPKKAK